jgi:hypothetical protein
MDRAKDGWMMDGCRSHRPLDTESGYLMEPRRPRHCSFVNRSGVAAAPVKILGKPQGVDQGKHAKLICCFRSRSPRIRLLECGGLAPLSDGRPPSSASTDCVHAHRAQEAVRRVGLSKAVPRLRTPEQVQSSRSRSTPLTVGDELRGIESIRNKPNIVGYRSEGGMSGLTAEKMSGSESH